MLTIENARAGYGKVEIIHGVDLAIETNEAVALLGRNGVGKTTLLKHIMGIVNSFSGSVLIDGKSLPDSTTKRVRCGLGYVPQGRFVFPRLTVTENIVAAAAGCGHDKNREVERLFDKFPLLAERPNQMAGSLSGGQQQILAIARALATRPRMLLLDEPTEGIQPSIVDDIADMLLELNKEEGLGILVAEQNLDFTLTFCERAYVMDKGKVAQTVSRDQLLQDSNLVSELLGV
ncbi:MAG: ABC transporter ATP-binding protein [Arenicella sp.]